MEQISNELETVDFEKDEEVLQSDTNCYDNKTVNSLSRSFINLYKPDLTNVRHQVKELTDKQEVLVEQLHNENLKLAWSQNSIELQDMFSTMKQYHNKLLNIKKNMRTLHERSTKLKKRAVRLQQHVQKEAYIRNQQVQHEESLVSKSSPSNC